tara:strand:- start:10601 stop:11725 length:1125 start_codon:yes stop_codon:yes gene_type:complete
MPPKDYYENRVSMRPKARGNTLGNMIGSVFKGLAGSPFTRGETADQELRFPLEDTQDYGGFITFTAKQETPKPLGKQMINLFTDDDNAIDIFNESKRAARAEEFRAKEASGQNSGIKGISEQISTAKRDDRSPLPDYIGSGRTCRLYLPNALQFQDTVSYTNIELGVLGAVAERAMSSGMTGKEMLAAVGGNIKETFESLGTAFRNGMESEAAQIAALRLSRRLNTEIAGAISTQTGVALNPNRRSMLNGPNLRSFRFQFKMIPTSPDEARSIKSIIQFFREEMYPEATDNLGVSAALRYPSKFHIKLQYKTAEGKLKKVATGILPSFLQSVDVNYNPAGMAFHKDGEVQETDISLQFTEDRALTKRDVATGGY